MPVSKKDVEENLKKIELEETEAQLEKTRKLAVERDLGREYAKKFYAGIDKKLLTGQKKINISLNTFEVGYSFVGEFIKEAYEKDGDWKVSFKVIKGYSSYDKTLELSFE